VSDLWSFGSRLSIALPEGPEGGDDQALFVKVRRGRSAHQTMKREPWADGVIE
jgi:hypothetical protein